jgi:hypothetical protein
MALNFRLAVNILQLIYVVKKYNNWRFPTPPQLRISFERTIYTIYTFIVKYLSIFFFYFRFSKLLRIENRKIFMKAEYSLVHDKMKNK